MITFGKGAVLSVHPCICEECQRLCEGQKGIYLFQYSNLRAFDDLLRPHGYTIFGSFHHYLPISSFSCPAPLEGVRFFEQEEITKKRFSSRFPNALGFDAHRPDMLAVALFRDGVIAGLAGASADCAAFWQIGVDVPEPFQGAGIGQHLVALLRQEILRRGKIPYYGTSEANFASRGIAANTGFRPVWAEVASQKVQQGE